MPVAGSQTTPASLCWTLRTHYVPLSLQLQSDKQGAIYGYSTHINNIQHSLQFIQYSTVVPEVAENSPHRFSVSSQTAASGGHREDTFLATAMFPIATINLEARHACTVQKTRGRALKKEAGNPQHRKS